MVRPRLAAFAAYGIHDGIRRFCRTMSPDSHEYRIMAGRANDHVGAIEKSLSPTFDKGTIFSALHKLQGETLDILRRSVQARKMFPLMKEALGDPSISAWVADHDLMAITCLDFLRAEKVEVPERVALVSFDDSDEAAFRNLTSYNFNIQSLVHRVVSDIVHPALKPTNASRKQPIEVDGFISRRGTD